MSEPTSPPARDIRADIALLSVAFMWGINIPIMKYGIGFVDRLAFNAIRLTLSALVLGVMAWVEIGRAHV